MIVYLYSIIMLLCEISDRREVSDLRRLQSLDTDTRKQQREEDGHKEN